MSLSRASEGSKREWGVPKLRKRGNHEATNGRPGKGRGAEQLNRDSRPTRANQKSKVGG